MEQMGRWNYFVLQAEMPTMRQSHRFLEDRINFVYLKNV